MRSDQCIRPPGVVKSCRPATTIWVVRSSYLSVAAGGEAGRCAVGTPPTAPAERHSQSLKYVRIGFPALLARADILNRGLRADENFSQTPDHQFRKQSHKNLTTSLSNIFNLSFPPRLFLCFKGILFLGVGSPRRRTPNSSYFLGYGPVVISLQIQIQIQIRTCRARLTNCPGALTKCQKAMRNR